MKHFNRANPDGEITEFPPLDELETSLMIDGLSAADWYVTKPPAANKRYAHLVSGGNAKEIILGTSLW